jgi:hypothetical protein
VTRRCTRPARRAAVIAAVAGVLTALALLPSVAGAQAPFTTLTVTGPNPSIVALGNVALARDGSGGLVYLASVNGVAHVFASIESNGSWGVPAQLDVGLAGPASTPVIAAAQNGRLVAEFVSGGTLYASVRAGAVTAVDGTPAPRSPSLARLPGFGAPQGIATASNPALSMANDGTAYTAFTVLAGTVSHVHVARLDRTSVSAWQAFGTPLNLDPTRSAGYNSVTRPQLAVATDATAIVAWGEDGADGHTHVIVRRVDDTGPDPAPQDLSQASLNGAPGGAADSPSVSAEDISDFAWVAFRQSFAQGAGQVSRTLAAHQLGSRFDPAVAIDPLAFPTADGADQPTVQINGNGSGASLVETTASHQVYADPLNDPLFQSPEPLDAAGNAILPEPVLAISGVDNVGAAAWLRAAPGAAASVLVRAWNGSDFEPAATASSATLGAVSTAGLAYGGGLSVATDRFGDAFVAFLQGAPGATRIQIGGVANPPGQFHLTLRSRFTASRRPLITWSAAKDTLGLRGYEVFISGHRVAITGARAYRPSALSRGTHRVTIVAVNGLGQTTQSDATVALVVGSQRRVSSTRRRTAKHAVRRGR